VENFFNKIAIKNYSFPNAFLLKTNKIPTPVEIAISATLKIALKKEI
jgi:hypothetical protein